MKTATINYEDFEVLIGTAVVTVALLEPQLLTATGEELLKTQVALAQVRAAMERATTGVVVREQPEKSKGFQQRLDEAIAAARAKQ